MFLFLFLFTNLWGQYRDCKILSSSSNHLLLEFTPADWQMTDRTVESRNYKVFDFNNAVPAGEEDHPRIPVRIVHIGVPLSGNVTAQVVNSDFTTIQDIDMLPVPRIESQDGEYIKKYYPAENIYNSTRSVPENLIELQEPDFFRSQRRVRLIINPLQYNPAGKEVRQYNRIVVRVIFSNGTDRTNRNMMQTRDDHIYKSLLVNYDQARTWRTVKERSLRKTAKNVLTGGNWYKFTIKADGKTMLRDAKGDAEGIYKLDGATLKSAGIAIESIDPSTIQLFNNGGRELPEWVGTPTPDSLIENAILVVGGEDGTFNSADYILFYGRSLVSFGFDNTAKRLAHYIHHYDEENGYFITFGKQKGKRIQTANTVSVDGVNFETDFKDLAFFEREEYNVFNSGPIWLDRSLTAFDNMRSYSFNLQDVNPANQTVFRFSLANITTGNHMFTAYANGNKIGNIYNSFYSSSSYRVSEDSLLNYSVLMNGTNTISIEYNNSSDTDFSYVDWLEVQYSRAFKAYEDQLIFHGPVGQDKAGFQITGFSNNNIQVFDITDFADVKMLNASTSNNMCTFADENITDTPRKYVALTSLAYKKVDASTFKSVQTANLRTFRNVDYIIITPAEFEQQAMILESLREDLNPEDRLETEVVKIADIYEEFGWGIKDPAAIRNFLVYALENWEQPHYVLLFGDGHYDYKDIRGFGAPNLIPPFETNETNENLTRPNDDWFVYTDGNNPGTQMAIGRINARTVEDAQNIVDKIRLYEAEPEYGEWRNTFTLVGDDELQTGGKGNQTEHTVDAENLSKLHVLNPFNFKKIYLIEYPAVKTASISGITKPTAREALLEQLVRGTLIVNFIGHGNDQRWAHEKVLYGPTDFDLIQNDRRMALWIAATCEFARWDQPQDQSLAEQLIEVANRGAIAMVASSRLVFSDDNIAFNRTFLNRLFAQYEDTGLTERLGDAVMLGKQDIFYKSKINSEKYLLLGDPAMRIGAPRYSALIDRIEPDSIQALRKMAITGHVEKDNILWNDFNGKILVRVLDSPKSKEYFTVEEGDRIVYEEPGNGIFRGKASIQDGNFYVQFIVPKDISYNGTRGRVSVYFWNEKYEGSGLKDNLIVGGTATDLVDHEGPEMTLHFGDPGFAPGDYTTTNPVLYIEITDSVSGINTAGDIGHQIMVTIDEDDNNIKDITDFFEYDEGSYVSGTAKYPILNITEGPHTIKVKAWDNSNNSSNIESDFVAVADDELRIRNVLNYPNPMTENTQFTFELSRDADVEIKIYSVAGRLLRKFDPIRGDIGFNIFPERWDGTDQDGDKLANGVYLYKIKAGSQVNGKSLKTEQIGKLIIAR